MVSVPDTPPVPRVLFVCTANICRSAYAERRTPSFIPAGHRLAVTSAGVFGLGRARMDPPMAEMAKARGAVDVEGYRSKPLSPELLAQSDVLLTMETAHRTAILDDHPGLNNRVFTIVQFADAIERVDPSTAGRALIGEAARLRGQASPDDDIRDPYRRGAKAARECADELDGLLQVIVPRLSVPKG